MSSIILIGYMGCGKSTIGKRLSYAVRKPFLDTDKIIERKADRTISELFAEKGEAYFRDMETACIRELMAESGEYVIAAGGGLALREENRRLLKELGKVVYLRADPETIYERLKKDDTRPLLKGENPKEKIRIMMGERAAVYEEAAEIIIDVDGKDFEDIVKEIGEKIL
ncbi:MAG: shikimate kinase [Lachnospiraceae bacterium]|nr:shikimate kinase [Lachnospiraceae bacterium]